MRSAIRPFHFISWVAFGLGESLIRLLPLGLVFVLGQFGGEIAYRLLRRRRALALSNLRLAFGREMPDAELRAINRRHFQLLGANVLCGIKASTLPNDKIWERVTTKIPDNPENSGWIALVTHTGNWELYSHLGEKYPEYRFGSVYQPLANPYIDRHVRAQRTSSGIRLFDRRTQLLSCVRFLREGGIVGVLSDQGAGYAGLWTPLFGRLTSSSTLAARLALRTSLPLLPLAIRTIGRARWELVFSDAIFPEKDETAESLTARINCVLESQIRNSPADWLWVHNRWKPLRPHVLFARDQRHVFFPSDFDQTQLDPFRILITSPKSEEDAAATVPALRAIQSGRPDVSVTILANESVAEFWRQQFDVKHLIIFRETDSVFALARAIRQTARFDVAISFASSRRISLAIFLAGIPLRIGRAVGLDRWLCNQHPAEPGQPLDSEQLSRHIARSAGAEISVTPA